jgi:amino acid transporter
MRVVSRWDLTVQGVNIVLASSIFVLPGVTLTQLGSWSPLAVVIALIGVTLILLSFAEAAGRSKESGGPYRYTADAFGEFVGTEVGILFWAVRASATAAVADIFATYTAELWPPAATPVWRCVLITMVIFGSCYLNVRGTKQAASALNLLTMVKVLPLLILCGFGFFSKHWHGFTPTPLPGAQSWARAVLLWVFAFGGFEATLIPASEAQNPTRDMPRALFQALAIVAFFYLTVQLLLAGLPLKLPSARPVGDAARLLFGAVGATATAVAAMLATGGHIGGSTLVASRITSAMAEKGRMPAVLGRIHPRFRTPAFSIILFSALVWALAVSGSFIGNASISAVGRLVVFVVTFLANLRMRNSAPSAFATPIWVHLAAIVFCVWLFFYETIHEALCVFGILAATAIWWFLWPAIKRFAGGRGSENPATLP